MVVSSHGGMGAVPFDVLVSTSKFINNEENKIYVEHIIRVLTIMERNYNVNKTFALEKGQ